MKHITGKTRRIKKRSRAVRHMTARFFDLPFVKPAALLFICICILLTAAPYLIGKLAPEWKGSEKDALPEADFPLEEVPVTITVYRSEKGISEVIDFEDYVKGVVAGEMPSGFHIEALKAQAVAARTYSLARVIKAESGGNPDAHPDAPLCDTVHCQVYRSPSELKEIKGGEWMKDGWKRICKAVDETEGQLLYYEGSLVEQALFHSSSGGKTENSEDVFAAAVPYLVSVDSPYEDEATHSDEKNSFSIEEMAASLKTAFPGISFGSVTSSNIKILGRSSGNRVDTMQIGYAVLSGRQVREALELPSANFTIDISGGVITFTSNGSGHGVGMSQYGADGMAKEGYDYRDILQHYYSGTQIY